MRTAEEIANTYKSGLNHPEEIFEIYEELEKLPTKEWEKYRYSGIGDAIGMQYITAVEMKKKGKWDVYVKLWEENKYKTAQKRLKEYLDARGIPYSES